MSLVTFEKSGGSLKWGENPKGSVIFDANGPLLLHHRSLRLPHIRGLVRGSFANFGAYIVDEEKRIFMTKVDGSI